MQKLKSNRAKNSSNPFKQTESPYKSPEINPFFAAANDADHHLCPLLTESSGNESESYYQN